MVRPVLKLGPVTAVLSICKYVQLIVQTQSSRQMPFARANTCERRRRSKKPRVLNNLAVRWTRNTENEMFQIYSRTNFDEFYHLASQSRFTSSPSIPALNSCRQHNRRSHNVTTYWSNNKLLPYIMNTIIHTIQCVACVVIVITEVVLTCEYSCRNVNYI